MDNKYRYYELRNLAWQVLIDTQINALPIDINKILHYYNLQALRYDFMNSTEHGAHATLPTGQTIILYSNTCNEQQARFTIMHELGHILLDHNNFKGSIEKEANSFAARILMPVGILKKINVLTAEKIADVCNVSLEAAEFREKRIAELEKRGMWFASELENKLVENFTEFIRNFK